jgi:hypothetical protein
LKSHLRITGIFDSMTRRLRYHVRILFSSNTILQRNSPKLAYPTSPKNLRSEWWPASPPFPNSNLAMKIKIVRATAAGFEPARQFANTFRVYHLNHSVKQPLKNSCSYLSGIFTTYKLLPKMARNLNLNGDAVIGIEVSRHNHRLNLLWSTGTVLSV